VTEAPRLHPRGARDAWIVLGLVVLAVAIPAALSTMAGAILLPHNDDFGYRRIALTMAQTGRLDLIGWPNMSIVGQILFAVPFLVAVGGSPWAFAAATATLTVTLIVAGYDLARRVLSPPRAAFAMLTLLLFPGLLRDTTTFMTDIPALAAELLCLALAAAALGRTEAQHRWRWLAASLVVGCWAFSIREFGLAAPIAVLVAAFASEPGGRRTRYAIACFAVLVAIGGIYYVSNHLPDQQGVPLRPFPPGALGRIVDGAATLAFVLGPALVLCAATWLPTLRGSTDESGRHRRRLALAGALVGLIVAAVLCRHDLAGLFGPGTAGEIRTLVGNLLAQRGIPDAQVLAGVRPNLFPTALWTALNVAALVAVFAAFATLGAALGAGWRGLLGALDLRRRPSPLGSVLGMLVVFSIVYGAEVVAFGFVGPVYDRYLWPLALSVSVVLLWRPAEKEVSASKTSPTGNPWAWLAGAMLGGIGVLSLALLLNSLAFDAARWRAGEAETARGVPPMWIDAGLEWLGAHNDEVADAPAWLGSPSERDPTAVPAPFPRYATRYTLLWSSDRQCVVVSSSRLDWPGLTLAETRTDAYRMLLFVGARTPLYIYRSTDPTCAP